jgi:hypothetical protein
MSYATPLELETLDKVQLRVSETLRV